ncbi:hypothetical protein Tco_0893922 [Tanacetum coccineum]|uniref:Uncharacterized protein n=1 Tax=Tanacetum coccineum TaxID=301880 RepID=A0ABQ5CAC9_9ASTR
MFVRPLKNSHGPSDSYGKKKCKDKGHGPSDAMHNPPQPLKVSQQTLVSFLTEITRISIDFLTPKRFYTSAGNPVKEILLKLNLPDHRILKDGGEGT